MSEINIDHRDDTVDIWIDVQDDPFNGVCIGVGDTKAEAIESAITDLEETIQKLRNMR